MIITQTFKTDIKALSKSNGIYEAMISTESIDRSGDIVRASGVQLDNYKKNPVVLWGHDYHAPPIAKTTQIDIIPGRGLKARFEFPPVGISSLADTVRGLWEHEFVNATSIGFDPITSRPIEPGKPFGPQEYTKWELLEFSIVTVPANQDAVRLAFGNSFGGDTALKLANDRLSKAVKYYPRQLPIQELNDFINALGYKLSGKEWGKR